MGFFFEFFFCVVFFLFSSKVFFFVFLSFFFFFVRLFVAFLSLGIFFYCFFVVCLFVFCFCCFFVVFFTRKEKTMMLVCCNTFFLFPSPLPILSFSNLSLFRDEPFQGINLPPFSIIIIINIIISSLSSILSPNLTSFSSPPKGFSGHKVELDMVCLPPLCTLFPFFFFKIFLFLFFFFL